MIPFHNIRRRALAFLLPGMLTVSAPALATPSDAAFGMPSAPALAAPSAPAGRSAEQPAASAIDSLVSWINHSQHFREDFAQEKVCLFFDNSNYYLGENLWFKAYVLLAENHHYTTMSQTLYVELLSTDGNCVERLKLPVRDGQADGVFYLKPELSPGFYEIRAYTRCMLNFGSEVAFSRVFPVFDACTYKRNGLRETPTMKVRKSYLPSQRPTDKADKGKSRKGESETAASGTEGDISFYPEGGHLLSGVENRVAFKAVNTPEGPQAIAGIVEDDLGNEVAMLQTEYEGMGQFGLIPEAGRSYRVRLGNKTYPLPRVESQGIGLQVNALGDDQVIVTLQAVGAVDSAALVFSCRGRAYGFNVFSLPDRGKPQEHRFSYPKRQMPAGVNEVFVYDTQGRILASRLFFVHPAQADLNPLEIDYAFDKLSYKRFDPIQVKINLKRTDGQPVSEGLCLPVAVRDGYDCVTNAECTDLGSQLLLSSDLKGYIHNPSDYFAKDDRRHRRALDLLMCVQGWRRYDWELMSGRRTLDEIQPVEDGILLLGQVLSVVRRHPLADMNVTMWTTSDSMAYHGRCTTDEDGKFNFLFDFEGKWNLSLQITDDNRRKNCFITLDRNFWPETRRLDPLELRAPTYSVVNYSDKGNAFYESDRLHRDEIFIMPGDVLLKEAEVVGKSHGDQLADYSITYEVADEMDKFQDAAEYTYEDLNLLLPMINPNFTLRYVDSGEVLYYRHARVVFYDERWHRSSDDSMDFEMPLMSELERIAIVEPGSFDPRLQAELPGIQDMGKDVAYVIMYRLPGSQRREDKVGIRTTTLQGYNKMKAFYHPKYDKSLTPDYLDHRRTLYWNPSLPLDGRGQAEISFYNNADSKHWVVDAAIVTPDGQTGRVKQAAAGSVPGK